MLNRSSGSFGILATAIIAASLAGGSVQAQFSGATGAGGGFGGNLSNGGGGFGNSTGTSNGFGSGIGNTNASGTAGGTNAGASGAAGFGTGAGVGYGNFPATSSNFGTYSFGRVPFGATSNLRGPQTATTGVGAGAGRSSAGQLGATGLGGVSGLGGLGGIGGGLGGFGGGRNVQQNFNQQQPTSPIRTRLLASTLAAERAVATVEAVELTERIARLPGTQRYQSANIRMSGRIAVIDAPLLADTEIRKLSLLLSLEPGIDSVQVNAPAPESVLAAPIQP